MPSIESPARNRLRDSPYKASRTISRPSARLRGEPVTMAGRSSAAVPAESLMSHLVAKRLDGRELRRTPRGEERGDDADQYEGGEDHGARAGCQDHSAEALRHREQVDERAEPERDAEADGAAHGRDHEALEEELPEDDARRGAKRLSHA